MKINHEFNFPKSIPIQCSNGDITWQRVIYEWMPSKCSKCNIFGYTNDACKSKKVWTLKANAGIGNGMDIDEDLVRQDKISTKIFENERTKSDNYILEKKENQSCSLKKIAGVNQMHNYVSTSNPFNILIGSSNVIKENCKKEMYPTKIESKLDAVDSAVKKVEYGKLNDVIVDGDNVNKKSQSILNVNEDGCDQGMAEKYAKKMQVSRR